MEFTSSTEKDISQIREWIKSDIYHNEGSAEWWLTGNNCLFAGCLRDDLGAIVYFRVDEEEDFARLHVQFAPEESVNKNRLIKAIIQGYIKVESLIRKKNLKGVIFYSVSPRLVKFMKHLGFKPQGNDFYRVVFQEQE